MSTQHKRQAKMNIPMCVAAVLLCLTMITTHMMFGLYARYVVKSEGGDVGRVAAFDVAVEPVGEMTQGFENLNGKQTAAYRIILKNQSEVAVACTVNVSLDEDLVGAIVTVDKQAPTGIEDAGRTLIFEKVTMVPINDTATCDLQFVVDAQKISAKYAGKEYEWSAEFEVSAEFVQID